MTSSPPNLLLLAGGGHAAELFSYLDDLAAVGQPIRLLGVVDEVLQPGRWEESEVLGDFRAVPALLRSHSPTPVFLTAVGSNHLRRELVARAAAAGLTTPWTLRHPLAAIGRRVEVGAGTLLAPGAIVTTRVRIGAHCLLNVRTSVSHDCVLGDFVNINPGAIVCGGVQIGEGAFVGAGAVVRNGVRIGTGAVIGAGAVVLHDVPPDVTVVGVPAKLLRRNPEPWGLQ